MLVFWIYYWFLCIFYYSLLIFLAMGLHVNYEEYAPLGDFMMVSFVRDRPEMELKFTSLNVAYLGSFQEKLAKVKELEDKLNLTEEQKGVTKSLYEEAAVVNDELNFLSEYMRDVSLPTSAISVLKKSLHDGNIEGGLLELKALIQYVRVHQDRLKEKGMDANFPDDLNARMVSMAAKNTMQNKVMNLKKDLVLVNQEEYDALYAYISNVAKKGKVLYKGKGKEDEYVISKIIARMRAPKRNDKD